MAYFRGESTDEIPNLSTEGSVSCGYLYLKKIESMYYHKYTELSIQEFNMSVVFADCIQYSKTFH
jgi:hypothetical protein